jgi:flavine halogenase
MEFGDGRMAQLSSSIRPSPRLVCCNSYLRPRENTDRPNPDTDFIAAGGPNGYAWNLIRSEADEILFRHAGESGAQIFDAVKVTAVQFEPSTSNGATNGAANGHDDKATIIPGRPVSATWASKDGTSGTIKFDYIIDASGRNGILSTKYLKNRKFTQSLKYIANWGYWRGGGIYGAGTSQEGCPFFQALSGTVLIFPTRHIRTQG